MIVKEDGKFRVIHGTNVTFTSRRQHSIYGHVRNSVLWPSERRAVVVPLYWNHATIQVQQCNEALRAEHHPSLETLITELGVGNLLRTYRSNRPSEYHALMYVGDIACKENGFGRNGVLLDKALQPIVVTSEGIDYIVEMKGVGLARHAPFNMDWGRYGNKPFGSMVVDEADTEYQQLLSTTTPYKGLITVHYTLPEQPEQGTVAYFVRLNSLGTLRAAYQDFHGLSSALPKVSRRDYVCGHARSMSLLIAQGSMHTSPHPENVAVSVEEGKSRMDFIDYADVKPFSRMRIEDKTASLMTVEEIGEIDRREFVRTLGGALLGYGRINENQYSQLLTIDTQENRAVFYLRIATMLR